MTAKSILIDNKNILDKYTDYEIKLKFYNFILSELNEDSIELYEITVNDLSDNSKERLKNIDKLNFVNY